MRNTFLLLFMFSYLLGWGNTGHRIVGKVAEDYLTEKAKQNIISLIGHHDLAMLSNWADEIKSDPNWRHANDWHYATIPDGEDYKSGKHRGKIIEKVQEFSEVLLENRSLKLEKQNALKFLIHFIGDIHQPLHIGNGNDRGGNSVKVVMNGDGELIKIHMDDTLLKEPKEILEDLIVAAHNDAKLKLKNKTSEEISKVTGGISLPPGFKLPF